MGLAAVDFKPDPLAGFGGLGAISEVGDVEEHVAIAGPANEPEPFIGIIFLDDARLEGCLSHVSSTLSFSRFGKSP